MRITVISDIHADLTRLGAATPVLTDSDVLVVSGDLSRHGDPDELKDVVSRLQEVHETVMAIPGNMDGAHSVQLLEDLGVNLHGVSRTLEMVRFAGAGGSMQTPFGTPFELPESEIVALLESGLAGPAERRVAVCHNPPYGTKVDRIMLGRHVGGRRIRAFVEKAKPDVFLCGHIHESVGVDRIGDTLLVNPGPFRRGGIGVVTIPDKGPAFGEVVRI